MTKRRIRLTESGLNKIIKSCVARCLNEGATADSHLIEKWDKCIEMLGAEGMLSELWNCLNADEIRENLEWIDRNNDLGLFDDENEDDYGHGY